MAVIQRITDFIPNTLIVSQEVDDEFNQLVNLLSGTSTNKDALIKYSHATDPVLRVDQLGAGVVQQWLQNGTVKSRINNNGSLESIAGPVIAASQLIAAPLTIDGTTDIILKASGFIVGVERAIQASFGAVGANSGAGLTSMFSSNIPAGNLAANNDYAVLIFNGGFAANDNDKRLQLSIAGTVFLNTGLSDLDTFGYSIVCVIGRIDSTHIAVNTFLIAGQVASTSAAVVTSTGSIIESANSATFAVADLASNNLAILLESQGTANNDIVLNEAIIKVCQMS